MAASGKAESGARFIDYLSLNNLPVAPADVRVSPSFPLTVARIEHAPNRGIWFDPIDDLVISVVLRSDSSRLTRDVGHGKTDIRYRPGTILITPPATPSYWRFEGKPHVLHLSLPRHVAAGLAGTGRMAGAEPLRHLTSGPLNDPLIADVAKRISRHDAAGRSGAVVERGVGFLMSLLMSHRGGKPRDTPRRTPLPSWQLAKVLAIMEEHKLDMSVSDLAGRLGLSTDHFIRSFKAATGLSPGQAIRGICLREAMTLLRARQKSITEIAMELGFSSPSHFSTFFRTQTGDAPTIWLARLPLAGEVTDAERISTALPAWECP